jgi:hypothetical protein
LPLDRLNCKTTSQLATDEVTNYLQTRVLTGQGIGLLLTHLADFNANVLRRNNARCKVYKL